MAPKKAIPSTSNGGNSRAFDDLTAEEKLSLLKSEFEQLTSECLEDILKSFQYDYETTRSVVQELFPSMIQTSPNGNANGRDEFLAEQNSMISGSDLFLEISPDFFAGLHSQFGGSDESEFKSLSLVARDFETQGSLLMPLDSSVASAIYKNILQFVRHSNIGLEQEDNGLGDVFESHDEASLVSLQSLGYTEESGNLKEIMELEAALKASREEYMQDLSKLAKIGINDAAVNQELCLEKKRMFIVDKFPGLNEQHLNNLFEINW